MRTLEQEISPTVVNKWLKNMTNRSAALFLDRNSEISEVKCNKSRNLKILSTLRLPSLRTREVVLPRFKLEQNYDLIENLKEMGLTDIFQESGDFSGMTSEKVFMNWVRLRDKAKSELFFGHSAALEPSLHA